MESARLIVVVVATALIAPAVVLVVRTELRMGRGAGLRRVLEVVAPVVGLGVLVAWSWRAL